MGGVESTYFVELLVAYEKLWVEYSTLKYLRENPTGDAEEARGRFRESASAAILPLAGALHAGNPLRANLQVALQKLSLG